MQMTKTPSCSAHSATRPRSVRFRNMKLVQWKTFTVIPPLLPLRRHNHLLELRRQRRRREVLLPLRLYQIYAN